MDQRSLPVMPSSHEFAWPRALATLTACDAERGQGSRPGELMAAPWCQPPGRPLEEAVMLSGHPFHVAMVACGHAVLRVGKNTGHHPQAQERAVFSRRGGGLSALTACDAERGQGRAGPGLEAW